MFEYAVKTVRILNFVNTPNRPSQYLTGAIVELKRGDEVTVESQIIGDATGKNDLNISFANNSTQVDAWGAMSSTGEPLLSDYFKAQIKGQMSNAMDLFDNSIALIFGNKTTIGQVCSFAQGLALKSVNRIPGFCCLDAPYQSKEHWGEKVSFWDKKVKEKLVLYCSIKTNRFFSYSSLAKSTHDGLMGVNM